MENLEVGGRYQIVRNLAPPESPRPLYYARDLHMPFGTYCAIEEIDLREASPADYLDIVGELDRNFQDWLTLHYENPAIPRPVSRFDRDRVLYRAIALDTGTCLAELDFAEFGGVHAFLRSSLEMLAWLHDRDCIHGHLRTDTLVCQLGNNSPDATRKSSDRNFLCAILPLACSYLETLDGPTTARDDLAAIAAIAGRALTDAATREASGASEHSGSGRDAKNLEDLRRFLRALGDPHSAISSAELALSAFDRELAIEPLHTNVAVTASPLCADSKSTVEASATASATIWPRHSRISMRPALRSRQLLDISAESDRALSLPSRSPEAHATASSHLQQGTPEARRSKFPSAFPGTPDREHAEARYSANMQYWYEEAIAARDRGELALAVAAFERALTSNAERTHDWQSSLARICRNRAPLLQQLGRYAKALRDYRSALEVTPDDLHLIEECGRLLLEVGRSHEARAMFAKLRDVLPNLARPPYWQGRALAALNDRQGAIEAYRKALELASHNGELFLCLGLALEAVDCDLEAIAAYDRALREPWKGEKNLPLVYYRLGRLLFAQETGALEASTYFDAAIVALDRPEIDFAPVCQLPDIADPAWPTWQSDDPLLDLWRARAGVHLTLGNERAALTGLERACDRHAHDSELWNARARLHRQLGDFEHAAIAAEHAATLDPSSPTPWSELGAIFAAGEARELAEGCYRKACLLYEETTHEYPAGVLAMDAGSRADLWLARSVNVLALDRTADAFTYARRALAIDPHCAEFHAWIGGLFEQDERNELAGQHYHRQTQLAPNDVEAWLSLARSACECGNPEASLVAARRAIEVAPRDARGWFLCGVSLQSQHRYGRALSHYRQACARDRSHVLAHRAVRRLRWYGYCDRAIGCVLPNRLERRLKNGVRRRLPRDLEAFPEVAIEPYWAAFRRAWRPFVRALGRLLF